MGSLPFSWIYLWINRDSKTRPLFFDTTGAIGGSPETVWEMNLCQANQVRTYISLLTGAKHLKGDFSEREKNGVGWKEDQSPCHSLTTNFWQEESLPREIAFLEWKRERGSHYVSEKVGRNFQRASKEKWRRDTFLYATCFSTFHCFKEGGSWWKQTTSMSERDKTIFARIKNFCWVWVLVWVVLKGESDVHLLLADLFTIPPLDALFL